MHQSEALRNVHLAPNTLKVAAMFAVMTRLEESKKANVDIVKKMKLYDGEDVEGFKSKDVRELREETVREGMDGISPRYIINRLSSALVRDDITCINPIDALRAIKDGFEQHTGISSEQRERYLNLMRSRAANTTRSPRSKCSVRLSTRSKRWPRICATTISTTSKRFATRRR